MKAPNKLKCPYCKATFLLKSGLEIHVKANHND